MNTIRYRPEIDPLDNLRRRWTRIRLDCLRSTLALALDEAEEASDDSGRTGVAETRLALMELLADVARLLPVASKNHLDVGTSQSKRDGRDRP